MQARRPRLPRVRTVRRGLAALLLWTAPVLAGSLFSGGFEVLPPPERGGSTFNWYRLGPGCDREPWGILANYHEAGVRAWVRQQLMELRASGQDRISLGLFHQRAEPPSADGRVTGTVLDSSAGRLHPQMEHNLIDLLADIRAAAFAELVFRYHPQGRNDVRNEDGWDDSLRDENWSLIASVEPLLQRSGVPWVTDLFAEGMPRARTIGSIILDNVPQFEDWSDYARFVWRAYTDAFGTANTLGFSFVSDTDARRIDARARHMDYIYGSRRPAQLGFSLYGGSRGEDWIFREYRRQLEDEGWGDLPWIITETWYDDPLAAGRIRKAMEANRKQVRFLIQWPVERHSTCSEHVSVAPPRGFSAYLDRGF